jgi:hypothetical protein
LPCELSCLLISCNFPMPRSPSFVTRYQHLLNLLWWGKMGSKPDRVSRQLRRRLKYKHPPLSDTPSFYFNDVKFY